MEYGTEQYWRTIAAKQARLIDALKEVNRASAALIEMLQPEIDTRPRLTLVKGGEDCES